MNKSLLIYLLPVFFLSACATADKTALLCPDCPDENQPSIVIENKFVPRIIVRGTVNGRPEKFFLDTGSFHSSLIKDKDIDSLPATGKFQFAGATWNPATCDTIMLDKFQVAGLLYERTPIARCEPLMTNTNILGLEYLDHQVVALAFQPSRFGATRPLANDVVTKPLRRNSEKLIEIPVRIAGDDVWALFDTGCSLTTIDEDEVAEHFKDFTPVMGELNGKKVHVTFDGTDATGHVYKGKLYLTDSIRIGDVKLAQQLVLSAPFSPQLKERIHTPFILGANAILQLNWVFDLKRNVWAAWPVATDAASAKMHMQVSGYKVTRVGDSIILEGEASLQDGPRKLAGHRITLDMLKKTIACLGECVYTTEKNTLKIDAINFLITNGDWLTQK